MQSCTLTHEKETVELSGDNLLPEKYTKKFETTNGLFVKLN